METQEVAGNRRRFAVLLYCQHNSAPDVQQIAMMKGEALDRFPLLLTGEQGQKGYSFQLFFFILPLPLPHSVFRKVETPGKGIDQFPIASG